jgi:hypothetical protein
VRTRIAHPQAAHHPTLCEGHLDHDLLGAVLLDELEPNDPPAAKPQDPLE